MKKILAFFKTFGQALFEWFIASNRWLHLMIGGIIMIFMTAATVIWNPFNPDAIQAIFIGTLATFIIMCAVEYKDKAHGGKFDWKDINAGMLIPIIMDILVILLMVFK